MRHLLSWTILGSSVLALLACTSSDGGAGGGDTTGTGGTGASTNTGGLAPLSKVDKIDILLGIDNSRSMADKQEILAMALADLVQSLTNPPCVDASGQPVAGQPPSGADACPAGSQRSYVPIHDIHLGIITSSIGGHGSDSCPDQDTSSGACPNGANITNNDHGHLVTRTDPCGVGAVPTYQGKGFLAWDPTGKKVPPGESDTAAFTGGIEDLVLGAGQLGCGFESQLESWYRFLVEPNPYQTIAIDAKGAAQQQGTDSVLLAQRAAFLRPDSLLAILMLSDENDCSTKEYGQFYLLNQQRQPGNPNQIFHLPKARSECATNPNDPCCASCGQAIPEGCPNDPSCGTTTEQEDPLNLRCWETKRRFGIDFLYPTDRYVVGLTQALVPDRDGNMVDNPIFSNLDPSSYPNATVRDSGLVVLSGIVGVPWQDLARDPTDLTKGYKSAEEMAHATNGVTTWDVILGKPDQNVAPLDPHMIESNAPRSGTNPLTGDTLAPPSATEGGPDQINGHEYTPGTINGAQWVADDLEYACIFPLQTPRDCSDPSKPSCDCNDPANDNPLCADNGGWGRTLQTHAKAYPGRRQLNVLRDLGPQGVASSICPAQVTDPQRADYAYRPAVQALVARVRSRLQTP